MAALAIVNPKKRAKKRKPKVTAKARKLKGGGRNISVRAKNPIRGRKRRARRSNPITGGALSKQIMPALTGAAGAALVDKTIDMFGGYLPAQLRTGWGRYLALGGVALAVGFALDRAKILSPATRNSLVGGALTVTAYKAISAEIMPMVTGITMAPAPAAAAGKKGFQDASLMGFQPAMTLGEMVNNAPVSGDFYALGNGDSFNT